MQNFVKIFFSLVWKGVIVGVVALFVFFGWLFAVAQTTVDGWRFWKILDSILVEPWNKKDNDGMVKNAERLGGKDASAYQFIARPDQQCNPGMCMTGFNSDGTIKCE